MISRSLAWVAGITLLSGCVTVPEFRALEREVVDLKAGGGGSSGASSAPPNARLAELGSQLSELYEEVARLRGAVEQAQHAANEALTEARAARDAAAAAGPAVGQGGLDPGTSPEVANLSAEVKAYEEAFRLYRAANYDAAIDRFQTFLQNYPSSDYADNALFWLGDAHLKQGKSEQAVLNFADVVERYPDGNKVPDALYKQGVALLEVGEERNEQATYESAVKQIFERLITEYPDSDRVPEARRQLEKLGR